VDGYDAVRASAGPNKRAGNLVATYPDGELKGRLPFGLLSGAASENSVSALADSAVRGKNGSQLIAVSDNAETAEVNMVDLELGNLQVSCFDQESAAGSEDAATRVTVTNHSPGPVNVSRRLGTGRPFIRTLEPNTTEPFVVGVENTFAVQLQAGARTILVEGAARQTGQRTPDSACAVWATALFVE
jgi:hypothetical protein